MSLLEDKKWAESTDQQMQEIASQWAKKYAMGNLRAFQQFYTDCLGKLKPDAEIEALAFQNRLQTVAWAIDKQAFKDW